MTDKIITRQTEQNVQRAIIATLLLLGIYLTAQFYWNVLGFIELWASDEFVDLFKALFNLTVLLLVGAVFVRQLRVLRERQEEWEEDTEEESESMESSEVHEEESAESSDEEDESIEGDEEDAETESTEGDEDVEDDEDEKEEEDDVPWKQYGDADEDES
jgi:hypothetical protein